MGATYNLLNRLGLQVVSGIWDLKGLLMYTSIIY